MYSNFSDWAKKVKYDIRTYWRAHLLSDKMRIWHFYFWQFSDTPLWNVPFTKHIVTLGKKIHHFEALLQYYNLMNFSAFFCGRVVYQQIVKSRNVKFSFCHIINVPFEVGHWSTFFCLDSTYTKAMNVVE